MFVKIDESKLDINIDSIIDFEKTYKLILPNNYKDFLLKFNGYEMEENYIYKLDDRIYGSKINTPYFFPLEHIINNWKLLLEESTEDDFIWKDLFKNKIVSFAFDGLSQIELGICLKKKNNGKIYIIDREFVYDPPLVFLEKSFTAFIDRFEPLKE